MKNYLKHYLLALIAIVACATFTACDKDDDEEASLADAVVGTYDGDGVLTYNSSVDERFNSMTLILTKASDATVSVQLLRDGANFLKSGVGKDYNVTKTGDDRYELAPNGSTTTKITINQGLATYQLPITKNGNPGYRLNFVGTKAK